MESNKKVFSTAQRNILEASTLNTNNKNNSEVETTTSKISLKNNSTESRSTEDSSTESNSKEDSSTESNSIESNSTESNSTESKRKDFFNLIYWNPFIRNSGIVAALIAENSLIVAATINITKNGHFPVAGNYKRPLL